MGNPRLAAVRVACVALAAAIFVASSLPVAAAVPLREGLPLDKVYHVIVFALLGALVVAALGPLEGRAGNWRVFAGFALVAAYGIGDEIHQAFVPGRSADPFDALADVIGAAIGAAAVWWWIRRSTFAHPSPRA